MERLNYRGAKEEMIRARQDYIPEAPSKKKRYLQANVRILRLVDNYSM